LLGQLVEEGDTWKRDKAYFRVKGRKSGCRLHKGFFCDSKGRSRKAETAHKWSRWKDGLWIDSNTGSSIFAAIFYHWVFTYVAQVNSTGVIRSTIYNWLEYTPYILIAIMIIIVYGDNIFRKEHI